MCRLTLQPISADTVIPKISAEMARVATAVGSSARLVRDDGHSESLAELRAHESVQFGEGTARSASRPASAVTTMPRRPEVDAQTRSAAKLSGLIPAGESWHAARLC
jgi:hypothetical protein